MEDNVSENLECQRKSQTKPREEVFVSGIDWTVDLSIVVVYLLSPCPTSNPCTSKKAPGVGSGYQSVGA